MRRYVALFSLLALAACGTNSEDLKQIKDSQRQILAKLADLEKKIEGAKPVAARPQIDPNKVYAIPARSSPFKGPENAPVVLVEFSDFQCPFCAQMPPVINEVLKAYPNEVKFVYKELPLISIHPYALGAAKAAVAAQRQGKFWPMHDQLFANNKALQPEKLKECAQNIGLDMAKFEQDLNSPEVQKQIEEDMKLAQQVEVSGTPSLFINGKRVMNRGTDGMKQMIDDALKRQG